MTATLSTQEEWFRNYVSATMSVLGVHAPDADGDLPVHGATSLGWVRVEATEPWGVRVFALAAQGLPEKAAVLKELNALNLSSRAVHAFLLGGRVFVEHLLLADAVNTDALRTVISQVLHAADDLGLMLATVYGGSTPVPPGLPSSEG